MNASWTYIGCSTHSVPSLSKVAMRSRRRHEVRPALRRDARDEIGDRGLDRAVVPGRQRIGLRLCGSERSGPIRVGNAANVDSSKRRLRTG